MTAMKVRLIRDTSRLTGLPARASDHSNLSSAFESQRLPVAGRTAPRL